MDGAGAFARGGGTRAPARRGQMRGLGVHEASGASAEVPGLSRPRRQGGAEASTLDLRLQGLDCPGQVPWGPEDLMQTLLLPPPGYCKVLGQVARGFGRPCSAPSGK